MASLARRSAKNTTTQRKKKPYNASSHAVTTSPSRTTARKPAAATRPGLIQLKDTLDTHRVPSANDWQCSATDDTGNWLFVYGGVRPKPENSPEEDEVVNDFWRLDLRTHVWEDLTNRVWRRWASPFMANVKPGLPARTGAAMVFYRHKANGTAHLLIYGGCESDLTTTRADLFSVDIDTLTWTEHTNVGDGIGRIEPSMAILDRDRPYLCVFGGRSGPDFVKGVSERSFCVMRLEPDQGQWEWHIKQGEAASDIVFGSQGGAVPTKRGVLVLLGKSAPEIKDDDGDASSDDGSPAAEPIVLEEGNGRLFIDYNPQTNTFQALRVARTGEPPRKEELAAGLNGPFMPDCQTVTLRNTKPDGSGQIFMAAAYETDKDSYFNTELFEYHLGEDHDTLQCLGYRNRIWGFLRPRVDGAVDEYNLDGFITPGGRLLLMGDLAQEDVRRETLRYLVDLKQCALQKPTSS